MIFPVLRKSIKRKPNNLNLIKKEEVDKGVLRTAHKLFLVLRRIFDMIADDYNFPTSMKNVVVPNCK